MSRTYAAAAAAAIVFNRQTAVAAVIGRSMRAKTNESPRRVKLKHQNCLICSFFIALIALLAMCRRTKNQMLITLPCAVCVCALCFVHYHKSHDIQF